MSTTHGIDEPHVGFASFKWVPGDDYFDCSRSPDLVGFNHLADALPNSADSGVPLPIFLADWDSKFGDLRGSFGFLCCALSVFRTEAIALRCFVQLLRMAMRGMTVVLFERDDPSTLSRIQRLLRATDSFGVMNLTPINEGLQIVLEGRKSSVSRSPHHLDRRIDLESLLDRLAESVRAGNPFAMLRLGHCETRFIGYPSTFVWSDVQASAETQWGQGVDDVLINRMRSRLIEAALDADVVGMAQGVELTPTTNGILDYAIAGLLRELRIEPRAIASSNVHFELGVDERLLEILRVAQCVILVTPHAGLAEVMARKLLTNGRCFHVPLVGQGQVGPETDGGMYERERVIAAASHEVSKLAKRGAVVLVGGGVAAKHLVGVARRSGAVALDMGSVMDAWCGLETRGDGFPERLLTYLNPD